MLKRSLAAVAGLVLLAACSDPTTSPSALNDASTSQQESPRDPCRVGGDPSPEQTALKATALKATALKATALKATALRTTAAARVPSCPVQ